MSESASAPRMGSTSKTISAQPAKLRNKPSAPLPEAKGTDHTIIERPGPDGQYTTYSTDGTWKQYRGSGRDHGDVPRQNVKETSVHTNPKTGEKFIKVNKPRAANPDKMRRGQSK